MPRHDMAHDHWMLKPGRRWVTPEPIECEWHGRERKETDRQKGDHGELLRKGLSGPCRLPDRVDGPITDLTSESTRQQLMTVADSQKRDPPCHDLFNPWTEFFAPAFEVRHHGMRAGHDDPANLFRFRGNFIIADPDNPHLGRLEPQTTDRPIIKIPTFAAQFLESSTSFDQQQFFQSKQPLVASPQTPPTTLPRLSRPGRILPTRQECGASHGKTITVHYQLAWLIS